MTSSPMDRPAGVASGDAGGLWADDAVDVRLVQPFEANKHYRCPGCNSGILPGTGHVVAVPRQAADLRRHWHHPCWARRASRRPGRS